MRWAPERLFWVAVTLLGFLGASVILRNAIIGWIDFPTGIFS